MFLPPEEIQDVKELPIFVWDDVLLPFVSLQHPIHVAEPQYARMLADIEFDRRLFGVSPHFLLDRETGLPYVNSTGCIARLLDCKTFASGDSNIKIEGLARYRIVRYLETGKPYPVAEIKFFEEENKDCHQRGTPMQEHLKANELEVATSIACHTAQRVLMKIYQALGKDESEVPLFSPPDPVRFSFVVSTLFRFDAEDRLHLLQSPSPVDRLDFIIDWLEEFEEGVDENLERHALIDQFLKQANNKNKPNLS